MLQPRTALILIVLLALCVQNVRGEDYILRIVGPQSEQDTSQIYFEQLFVKALQHSMGPKVPIRIDKIPYSEDMHGGVARLLNKRVIDLSWSATDKEVESLLLPVKIPLVMGLLGYRVAIVHKDNLSTLSSLDDLKSVRTCQLRHWTDVKILEFNEFTVVPTDSFERTFEMTQKGRCDLFPRAIYEGYFELKVAQHRFPELVMFDDILLYYPFPLYVFTSKQNTKLNHMLYEGLSYMVKSGELLAHIKRSEITRHMFPLSKWRNKPIVHLKNPFLPATTPLEDESLWLNLNSELQ